MSQMLVIRIKIKWATSEPCKDTTDFLLNTYIINVLKLFSKKVSHREYTNTCTYMQKETIKLEDIWIYICYVLLYLYILIKI